MVACVVVSSRVRGRVSPRVRGQAEHVAVQELASQGVLSTVGQLVVEVHLQGCHAHFQPYGRAALDRLYGALEAGGMRCFALTPNLNPVHAGRWPACAEASFISLRQVREGWAGAHQSPCA